MVKLFRFLAVRQTSFLDLARSVVKDRDLLKPRMKITAYNQHDVGSSHEPWSCSSQPIYSLRSANVVMQSSEAKDLLSPAQAVWREAVCAIKRRTTIDLRLTPYCPLTKFTNNLTAPGTPAGNCRK